MGETGTLIEDDGSGTPFKVKFSDSETKWFVAANVALAGPGLKLKLEGGSLTGYAAGYPGTYRLVGSRLVNGRPAYQHTSDASRWIAFVGNAWMGQLESSLGEKKGFLDLTDSDAASPDVSAKTWTAWTGSAWVEAPQLKCTAWTPPPPPGLKLEVEAGPPSFEVLSAQSQTEEGGCVLRGEAGAGHAFNIAAAGGTGVWSFNIIRTNNQRGLFAYVGVASESFSAAHGGAAYLFDLFSGIIWSTKNAHEQSGDKIVLQTSDVLKGKTDGALIEMRVREAGGKRYVAFRVNGGGWNEVVADGLPGVVRPYARCGYGEDRIRLEKAPAIKAGAGSLSGDAAKYLGTYRLTSKLVNGRPAYQHTSDATRWIAFAGDRWIGQTESSLGEKKGFLDLQDSTAASPDVSTKTWKASSGAGSGWVEAPQLKCTAWTPPPLAFKLNERVECRDNGSDWKVGRVTSVTPLMVQLDGYSQGFTWDEVRALESGV
eukprot:jgi/Chrpa1/6679/Chrysochromulina_OHIO_Genome00019191-RA